MKLHPALKKVIGILKYFFLSLVLLFFFLVAVLNIPAVHRALTVKINSIISDKGLPLHAGNISLKLNGDISLGRLELIKSTGDTLVYAGNVRISINPFSLLFKRIVIRNASLHDVVVNLLTDNKSGQLEILSLFSNLSAPPVEGDKPQKPWDIRVNEVQLENIRFLYSDSLNGILYKQTLQKADLIFDAFSLPQKQLHIASLNIEKARGIVDLWSPLVPAVVTPSDPGPWKLTLRRLELLDINYTYNRRDSGQVSGQSAEVSLKRGFLSIESLDLARKTLLVSKLELTDPAIIYRSSNPLPNELSAAEPVKTGTISFPWTIECGLLGINNGSFLYSSANTRQDSLIQQYMPVHGFNTIIKDIKISPRESGLNISKLSFALNERNSLRSGEVFFRIDSLRKCNLTIELAASLNIRKQSLPAADDIVCLSAAITGSLDSLSIEKFNLSSASGIGLSISGYVTDVLKMPASGCDLKFGAQNITRDQVSEATILLGYDIKLPEFSPVSLTSTIKNSFLKPEFMLDVQSESGNIGLTGNIDLEQNTGRAVATLSSINLGEIFSLPDLGRLTANGAWEGGINPKDMSGEGTVRIDSVTYKNVTTHGIGAAISVRNNQYLVNITASDSALQCALEGAFKMDGSRYSGTLSGDFNVDAGRLHLLPGSYAAKGTISADFHYSADSAGSTVNLKDLTLIGGNKSVFRRNLSMVLNLTDNMVQSKLTTDFMTAGFQSQTSLESLKNIMQTSRFGKIFSLDSTNMINLPALSQLPGFKLTATARYDSIFNLYIPDSVFNFNRIQLLVEKKSRDSLAHAEIFVDRLQYNKFRSIGLIMKMKLNENQLNCKIALDSMAAGMMLAGSSSFDFDFRRGSMLAKLLVNNRKGLPMYHLGAEATKQNDRIILKSAYPEWILNANKWTISPTEFLSWKAASKDMVASLHLQHKDMRIDMAGRTSEMLSLDFQQVETNMMVTPGIIKYMPEGTLNAHLTYSDKITKNLGFKFDLVKVKWEGINIRKFAGTGKLVADSTGILQTESTVQLNDSSTVSFGYEPGNNLAGRYFHAGFKDIPMRLLEPLVNKYADRLQGSVSGEIAMGKPTPKRSIDGELRTKQVALHVIPLNSWFSFPDEKITVKQNLLNFNQFVVLDTLKQSSHLNGTINLEDPNNITADLHLILDKLQVMNTTVNDNQVFSGSVVVNSDISITGSLSNPIFKGNVSLENGTEITYRQIQDLEVQEVKRTILFAKLDGNRMVPVKTTAKKAEFNWMPSIQATIEINPKSIFNLEISKGFNIAIHVSGNGFLNYSMLTNNMTSLTGNYEVQKGTSEVKFPGWPMKYFTITSGSSLRWDGSIENPELNLEATTKVKGTYTNPIDNKNHNVEFIVSMKLTNQLMQPTIIFDIRSPDSYVASVLSSLPPDEVMRQAVNLLLFGSIDLLQIQSSSNIVAAQMASFWQSQLNSFTKTSFKNMDLSFGIDSRTETSASGTQKDKTNFSYAMERKMFGDRATFKLTGRLNDYSSAGAMNSIIENFTFEYALDKTGTKFLKLYRNQDYENILEGEIIKSGIGFLYHKNYASMKDLWRRPEKIKIVPHNLPTENKK